MMARNWQEFQRLKGKCALKIVYECSECGRWFLKREDAESCYEDDIKRFAEREEEVDDFHDG